MYCLPNSAIIWLYSSLLIRAVGAIEIRSIRSSGKGKKEELEFSVIVFRMLYQRDCYIRCIAVALFRCIEVSVFSSEFCNNQAIVHAPWAARALAGAIEIRFIRASGLERKSSNLRICEISVWKSKLGIAGQ